MTPPAAEPRPMPARMAMQTAGCRNERPLEAEHTGGLVVDDQFEFRRLHDRHVCWFGALRTRPKAEAKGRAMLAGRRVPKIAHARLAQISKGYLCMAALQQKQFAVG